MPLTQLHIYSFLESCQNLIAILVVVLEGTIVELKKSPYDFAYKFPHKIYYFPYLSLFDMFTFLINSHINLF